MDPVDQDRLEKQVHHALRHLPPRPAPASLEARVLAALAAREAAAHRPWWQNQYRAWPRPWRLAFVVLSLGLAGLALWATVALLSHSRVWLAAHTLVTALQPLWELSEAGRVLLALGERLLTPLSATGALWAIAIFALLYGLLFGLGATAYRTLWPARPLPVKQ